MIDNGRWTNCSNTVEYLDTLSIEVIHYHFATHYDADHIGCLDDLVRAGLSITQACYDRGGEAATDTFADYISVCGEKRMTAGKGQRVTLGANGPSPVHIDVVDLNGAGVVTNDENSLGMVLRLTYGRFDHVFPGDIPATIEEVVGPQVGDVEVCKVGHHGAAASSSEEWLNATTPETCVVSAGDGNPHGHPTEEAMARFRDRGVKVYWTSRGAGAEPDPAFDIVVESTIVVSSDGNFYAIGSDLYEIE